MKFTRNRAVKGIIEISDGKAERSGAHFGEDCKQACFRQLIDLTQNEQEYVYI